jgi:phosphate transporter
MGRIGITSFVPIVWLSGIGILKVNDFNTFQWSTRSLLGEAMHLSGLLDVIANGARDALGDISAWVLLASLLSWTTSALIMFSLIMAIGQNTGHASLFVVLSAPLISTSQLFHISSLPNALVSGVCIETIDEDPARGILNGLPLLLEVTLPLETCRTCGTELLSMLPKSKIL